MIILHPMRFILLVLLALLLAAPADAQRRRDRDRPTHDTFGEAGAFALAFSAGWLYAGPFMGGAGGRYWLTDRAVLTGSLRAGIQSRDLDDTGETPSDDRQDYYEAGLGLGIERHFGRSTRVSPFVALGTDFSVRRRDDESSYDGGGSRTSTYRTQTVGGSVFAGVEYRFAPSLTLAAAHAFGASYEWGEQTERAIPPSGQGEPFEHDVDLSAFRLGTSTTTLTLSVYF
jgi:hypothetical protein